MRIEAIAHGKLVGVTELEGRSFYFDGWDLRNSEAITVEIEPCDYQPWLRMPTSDGGCIVIAFSLNVTDWDWKRGGKLRFSAGSLSMRLTGGR